VTNVDNGSTLAHYGTPRHSGRYPWGSGEDPYQSATSFMAAYTELKKQNLTEAAIAKGLGFDSTSDLRARISISSNDIRADKTRTLQKLLDKGMSMSEATRQMGIPESSGRALMDPILQERSRRLRVTADILKKNVDEHGFVDVGKGTENHMGISDTQLKTAIAILKTEGYKMHYDQVAQAGTGLNTSFKVLTKDDVEWKEVHKAALLIPVTLHLTLVLSSASALSELVLSMDLMVVLSLMVLCTFALALLIFHWAMHNTHRSVCK